MLSRRRRSASRTRDPSCTVTKVRFPSFSPHLRVVVSAREEGGTDFRLFLTDHQPHPISTTQFLTCTGQKEVGKNKKIKDCGIRYCERCTLKRYVFLSPSPSPLLMNQTDDTWRDHVLRSCRDLEVPELPWDLCVSSSSFSLPPSLTSRPFSAQATVRRAASSSISFSAFLPLPPLTRFRSQIGSKVSTRLVHSIS
jgi:hypothetical protein